MTYYFLTTEIEFVCSGSEGHGSLLLENTAGQKIRKLLDRIMDFRQSQMEKLKQNPNLTIGDVTTVNLTILKVSSFQNARKFFLLKRG